MRHSLIAAGMAVLTLLAACTSPAPRSSPAWDASRTFGPGAYVLRGHERGYSAQVVVKQVEGGIAVLAAGGSYRMGSHLCSPGFRFVFSVNGRPRLAWDAPPVDNCLTGYAPPNRLVCLSSSDVKAGPAPGADLIGGCDHPVFPVGTGTGASLTAIRKTTGTRYTVKTVGIALLPRNGARTEQ